MAWVTPKTDWDRDTDRFNATDYNRLKGNISYLYQLLFPYHVKVDETTIAVGNTGTYDTTVSNIPQGRVYEFDVVVTGATTNYTETYNYVTGDEGAKSYEVTATTEELTMEVWFTNRPVDVQYFEIEDMGNDKAVNDYWYADEWNTLLDNLREIAGNLEIVIDEMPIYYPNGATPTDDELNLIENNCLVLYNASMGGA